MLFKVIGIVTLLYSLPTNASANNHDLANYCKEKSCIEQFDKLKRQSYLHRNPYSSILLATAFIEGVGVEKDYKKAYKLLRRSLSAGSNKAPFMLSAMYKDGLGVEQDMKESMRYLEIAVKRKYPPAQYVKALTLISQNTDAQKRAIDLLTKAADRNHKESNYLLALLYESGELMPRDLKRAAKYYRNAAFFDYLNSNGRLQYLAKTVKLQHEDYHDIQALAKDVEIITITSAKSVIEVLEDKMALYDQLWPKNSAGGISFDVTHLRSGLQIGQNLNVIANLGAKVGW